MKLTWTSFVLFLALALQAEGARHRSPFVSTIDGVNVRNASVVSVNPDTGSEIIRGMEPRRDNGDDDSYPYQDFKELGSYGITDVLIFKQFWSQKDLRNLRRSYDYEGIGKDEVTDIPFKWSDLDLNLYNEDGEIVDNPELDYDADPSLFSPGFKESCGHILEGLKILSEAYFSAEPRKIYLHCTVGEDRTGLLSALWRLLLDRHLAAVFGEKSKFALYNQSNSSTSDTRYVFEEDMCYHGYGSGNPFKPLIPTEKQKEKGQLSVVQRIRASLTPVFLMMGYKIESGYLTMTDLESDLEELTDIECAINDPRKKSRFVYNPRYNWLHEEHTPLTCENSTKPLAKDAHSDSDD